ncbi:potassium-transporting ATPase subunit F [Peribacillus psychrosaccharolyticus]|uniref:Potassium-transporting ATPase subunit F n=1 Tax=Peribacillus psychrosaccharolyticus TaxID=1407 RepID=A0A974S0B9_PERPY|nr:potassium-transporting ATPase subunit F [Peribacillus psychrosaccharolyticus]
MKKRESRKMVLLVIVGVVMLYLVHALLNPEKY